MLAIVSRINSDIDLIGGCLLVNGEDGNTGNSESCDKYENGDIL